MKAPSLTLIFIFLFFSLTYSQTTNIWLGITVSWSTASNWSLGVVPNSTHDVVIPSGTPEYCYASASGGYNAYCNSLEIQSGGTLRVGYATITIDYDLDVYGTLRMSNDGAVLDVNNDVIWHPGSSNIGDYGAFRVYDHWTFEDGTNCALGTNTTVVFDAIGSSYIYCYDANATFGNVECDKPSGSDTYLSLASTHPMRVTGNMTVQAGNDFHVTSADLIVDDTLNIINAGYIYLEHSGGTLVNNSDLDLDGEINVDGGSAMIHGTFDIGSTGILTLESGTFEYDTGLGSNEINGSMNVSGGTYIAHEMLYVTPSGTITMSGGVIRSRVGIHAINSGNFQPTAGTFEVVANMSGAGTINCTGGNYFHDFSLDNPDPNGGITLASDVLVQNNFYVDDGFVKINEYELDISEDMHVYGIVDMDDPLGEISIGNDIIWYPGSNDDVSAGTINVADNWTFQDGTNCTLGTGSTVNFNTALTSSIMCYDADAAFGNVIADCNCYVSGGNTYPVLINGDLTVKVGMDVQGEDLIVNGTIDVENTAKLYLDFPGGSLVNNSDFELNGEMIVDGGDALIHGTFAINSTGLLSIASGSFEYDGGGSQNRISGTLDISGGIYQSDKTISIYPSGVVNMSGGTIKSRVGFSAQNTGNFHPTGGIVEFNKSSLGSGVVVCNSGNFFHNLHVNTLIVDSGISFGSDVLIKNNLEILAGSAKLSGQVVEVRNNVDIYGDIVIKESTDELDVSGDITFHSGSQQLAITEISDGTIKVAGDWYFNNDTDAQLIGTNTVRFDGSSDQYIYCTDSDAQFYDVVVAKLGNTTIFLADASTEDIHMAGDLRILVTNTLDVQSESLLVDGILDVRSGGKLYMQDMGGTLVTNSECELDGEMIIDGGDVTIQGAFGISSTGLLSIASGSFEYAGGMGQGLIEGTFNISGGTYQADESIHITSSGVVNMTGGIIRSQVGFNAMNPGNFQPTGGVVEFNRTGSGAGVVSCNNGNYFHDLQVNTFLANSGIGFDSDILIQNNLEILNGLVNLGDHKVEVQNNVEIYGDIVIKETGDSLGIGNDLTFHSGSQQLAFSEISEGIISVNGDWYFNNGTDAILEGNNVVNLNDSQVSTIYCNDPQACFHDLVINKSSAPTDTVYVSGSDTLRVTHELDIADGVFEAAPVVRIGTLLK